VVDIPQHKNANQFPGIFTAQLPTQPFLNESTIVCDSLWHSFQRVLTIDIDSGVVDLMKFTTDGMFWFVSMW
jgi:hypothetical protein